MTKIVKQVDDTVLSDELIAEFEAGASGSADASASADDNSSAPAVDPDQPAAPVQAKQAADGGEPVQVTDKKTVLKRIIKIKAQRYVKQLKKAALILKMLKVVVAAVV